VVIRDNQLVGPEHPERNMGNVVAIRVEDAATARFEDNVVERLLGGGSYLINAGHAYGLWIQRCDAAVVESNRFQRIAGGEGGPRAPAGPAAAVHVEDSQLLAGNNLVSDVRGHEAAAFRVSGLRFGEVLDGTYYDISGDDFGRGVHVDGEGLQALRVAGSIFSTISHEAVFVAEPPDGAVTLDYCAFDATGDPAGVEPGEGIVRAPAGFTQPLLGDFSLRANSACVDAGDPAAECDDEPLSEDESCRRDLGHLAGTQQARAR
jgi:hypothetical protein